MQCVRLENTQKNKNKNQQRETESTDSALKESPTYENSNNPGLYPTGGSREPTAAAFPLRM